MAIVTLRTVKEILQITDDTYNSLIDMFIPQVEADFQLIQGRDFDYDSNDDIEYPDNAELIAAQMIGFLIQTTKFTSGTYTDKTSESIGGYSYTRGNSRSDFIFGYPRHIVGRIERFVSLK